MTWKAGMIEEGIDSKDAQFVALKETGKQGVKGVHNTKDR